jgi:crotonobetainyl-CoA:carnitine CoA-transferase CaiB-like acyl-CoA transferase
LCAVLGLMELASEERYATNAARVGNRESLIARLSSALKVRRRDELLQALEAVGVPAGPINALSDVFADPQVLARGMRVDLDAAGIAGGLVPSVRTPIRFSDSVLTISRPSPRLGEHTAEVRQEII